MLCAARAHEDQVQAVLCWLGESDSLVVGAPPALDVFPPLESGVFDALRIDLNVLSTHSEVGSVDAVVHLVVLLSALVAVAQFALELQKVAAVFSLVFLCLQHVVALRTKPDALERTDTLFTCPSPLALRDLL
jgi:hypothetical protein